MHSSTKLAYSLANGETTLPAYAIGADFGAILTAEAPYLAGENNLFFRQATDTIARYMWLRDANANTLLFDPLRPGEALAQGQAISKLLDQTSIDLDRFIAKGGKLILVQPGSEAGLPSTATTEYYHRLLEKYGAALTNRFLRFYLIPGYAHGGGLSFNANGGPSFNALEDWVERGLAPGAQPTDVRLSRLAQIWWRR